MIICPKLYLVRLGGVCEGDEGGECGDELEGGHRLAKVVGVDAGQHGILQKNLTAFFMHHHQISYDNGPLEGLTIR